MKFKPPFPSNFPKTHLLALAVCALALGAVLTLLPSPEVEAQRTEISLTLQQPAADAINVAAPLVPAQSASTTAAITPAEPTALPEPPLQATEEPNSDSAPVAPPEQWTRVEVKSGDNLTTLFSRAGLGANQLYPMLNALKAKTDKSERDALKKVYPGETLAFLINAEQLEKVRHIRSPLESTLVVKTPEGYQVTEVTISPDIRHIYKAGTIQDSLFLDAEKAGLSQRKIMELTNIFAWDVDFALDIREGDRFSLIYEEQYLEGELIGEGNIVAAQFINRDKVFTAARHTDGNYYTPEGHSMRKAFLRTPVEFARISSRYNPNRKHPIFKTNRPHRGVDYAAPTGTPIKSSGDGKVIFAGRKGGYGKTVIVQHGQKYNTLYAHMSRIKPGMKRGVRVKQGQVIGYVGSTGYATGPHLHYEFRVNDVHRNPLTVPLPTAAPLPKKELAQFTQVAKPLIDQLELNKQTQVATQ